MSVNVFRPTESGMMKTGEQLCGSPMLTTPISYDLLAAASLVSAAGRFIYPYHPAAVCAFKFPKT